MSVGHIWSPRRVSNYLAPRINSFDDDLILLDWFEFLVDPGTSQSVHLKSFAVALDERAVDLVDLHSHLALEQTLGVEHESLQPLGDVSQVHPHHMLQLLSWDDTRNF